MFTGLGGERLWLCPSLNDSANDISGNGNNGSYQGGMATIADTSNGGSRCYDFDGTNDRIDCPSTVLGGSQVFSMSCWVYVDSHDATYGEGLMGQWEGSVSSNQVALIYTGPATSFSGVVTAGGSNYSSAASGSSPPTGSWHHLASVADGSNVTLYVDGVSQGATAYSGSINSSPTNAFEIGRYHGSSAASDRHCLDGRMDDIRAYDRALTQSEITHLASARGVQGGPYYRPLTLKSRVTRLLSNRHMTLLERIRSASKPTTPISIKVKHNEEPSYKASYAKNAGESENPHLWKGLVGAWMPSLGVTGETLRDVSGNGNHGTLTNMDAATDWVATSKGLALDFDGVDDVADIASPPSITGDSATLALWCKSNDSAPWRSPGGYVTSGFDDYRLTFRRLNTGSLQAYAYYSSGGRQSTGVYAISNSEFQSWNYYVVVASGGVVYLYLNGAIVASGGSGSGDLNLGTTFTLGSQDSRSSGSWWNGKISNVQVYNRALPPQEIQELYVDSLAPFRRKKSPIGYQPIKEIRGLIKTQEKI